MSCPGDCLLESGSSRARRRDVGKALEGIVRGIREALPETCVVFVEMFLRPDLPKARRSGTKAWVDADAKERAADVYHEAVVALHSTIAERYDCALVNLVPFFKRFDSRALDALFRDDCHHNEPGADYAAAAIAKCLEDLLGDACPSDVRAPMPRPVDAAYWRSHGAHRFDSDPNFLVAGAAPPVGRQNFSASPSAEAAPPPPGSPATRAAPFCGMSAASRARSAAEGALLRKMLRWRAAW